MTAAPVLYTAISPHGFGHISQTAPVINELFRRHPELRVVIESPMPREQLAGRFAMPFTHVPEATDFGMAMDDTFSVSVEQSHARYTALHADLDRHIAGAAYRIAEHRPRLVLCDVPYVPIVAAKRLGIPVVAMCCLNWADIYQGVCGGMQGAPKIHDEMIDAYNQADVFVTPAPTMPMTDLRNIMRSGPVAMIGQRNRDLVAARARVSAGNKFVLISMGGIPANIDLMRWPVIAGVTWLTNYSIPAGRTDMVNVQDLSMRYLDIMCSSDALVTKLGYGAFVEAACNGIPVLYVPRSNWPEAPFLQEWLRANAGCLQIEHDDLFSERLQERLNTLWRLPSLSKVMPTGIAEAAGVIESFFF